MHTRERLAALERALQPKEPYRLLVIPDDGDSATESAAYRERTGYRGALVVLTETDSRL